ncbi:DGQHR domain-containing protein [Sphingobacterium spiritivorum]|uniref:DGQHR domain-containing protein n=1 Tax=Sphingobacterium spiritivorum TaxID=258 RepID=UPI003DA2033C
MREEILRLPVMPITQPKGVFYMGSIDARELVNISVSDVRRIEDEQRDVERYLGIQRPLDKQRVKKIKEYIQSPDASFPTGIILAIDQDCASFDETNKTLILSSYKDEFDEKDISISKIAKVLDGQHRIAAFMNDQGNYDFGLTLASEFQLNVVIFIGLDIDEQANIFATVNLAQTKVNKSLVYDLEGLSKTKSPFKSAHQIAVALDSAIHSSPLFQRIKRLGVKTLGREESEPLTQAVFVESLIKLISSNPFHDRNVYLRGKKLSLENDSIILNKHPFRNLFIDDRDEDIALIVFNYFTAIKLKWPNAWDNVSLTGNILPKSNAFKAFMRFLKDSYLRICGSDFLYVPSVEEFSNIFNEINANDDDFTSGNFKPGSGGESAFYKLLVGKVIIDELKNNV